MFVHVYWVATALITTGVPIKVTFMVRGFVSTIRFTPNSATAYPVAGCTSYEFGVIGIDSHARSTCANKMSAPHW